MKKIDLFELLPKENQEVKNRALEYAIANQKLLTELDKISLIQLQLTTSIQAESGKHIYLPYCY